MNAKEMFEELSFEQIRNDDNYIEYARNGLGGYISILFLLRRKTIKPTYDYQARGINCHEIILDELKAIVQQAKELGWLEEKKEYNLDHYKEEIVELGFYNVAMSKGKVTKCSETLCNECEFENEDGKCIGTAEIKKWFRQPYKKPTYKLSQFEYDLLQSYASGYKFKDIMPLIAMKEKGYFKDINKDEKITDILLNCEDIQ